MLQKPEQLLSVRENSCLPSQQKITHKTTFHLQSKFVASRTSADNTMI